MTHEPGFLTGFRACRCGRNECEPSSHTVIHVGHEAATAAATAEDLDTQGFVGLDRLERQRNYPCCVWRFFLRARARSMLRGWMFSLNCV